ncbi:MAG: sigma-70 family RNA polymerase sigma factor [Planctomycetota bacterium]|jgi:RNA polymerase sigma-70 factor (ECF subfamily)
MSIPRSPESLLVHAQWVRALARSLLRDEHAADDIVQQTWLAAMEHPPRQVSKNWLGRVVRNLVATRWRREQRLGAREEAVARPERIASTAELAEAADWQRRIVAAVLELDAPHREVLLLRYFEDLTPQQIARRLGEPAGTVRSRLKRAHDKLRDRFDRETGGDRKAWSLALLPLATKGAAAVGKTKKLTLAALLLLCVSLLVFQQVTARSTSSTSRAPELKEAGAAAAAVPPQPREETGSARTGVAVTGRVMGRLGKSVAGARVTAKDLHATTDDSGAFTMTLPKGRSVTIAASAEGYGAAQVRIRPSESTGRVVIRLRPGGAMSGVVLDQRGRPVGGAHVEVLTPAGARIVAGDTASDGSYRLDGIAAGFYAVAVSHPEFVPKGVPLVWVPSDGQVIRLERGASMEGVTLDRASRAPVAGVRVQLRIDGIASPLKNAPTLEAVSDPNGCFRFERVPQADVFAVRIDAGRRGRYFRRNLSWHRRAELATVLLEPERGVQGVVLDPQGAPIPGLVVRGWEAPYEGYIDATTDAAGRFDLAGLPRLGVGIALDSELWSIPQPIPPVPKKGNLVLHARPARLVHGHVRDESGAPLAGASLFWRHDGNRAFAADDGSYRMRVPVGYNIQVRKHGYQAQGRKIEDGKIDFVLKPLAGRTLTGRVLDAAGAGLDGVRIECATSTPTWLGSPRFAYTWPDGRFELRDVEPGRQRLVAQRAGYQAASLHFEGDEIPDVTLQPGVDLRGTLEDKNGEPLGGISIAIINGPKRAVVRTRTDTRGRFLAHGLETGEVLLKVEADLRSVAGNKFELPHAGEVKLVADRGLAIEGVVLDSSGEPVEEAEISVASPSRWVRTDFAGRFRINGLNDQEYVIYARHIRRHRPGSTDEQFAPTTAQAGAEGVIIRAYRGRTIAGTLRGPDKQPLGGVKITLRPYAGAVVVTSAKGGFRFKGIPDGAYRIHSEDPRYYIAAASAISPGTEDVVARAERTLAIEGRIIGAIPKDAQVYARRAVDHRDAGTMRLGKLEADGTFRIAGLAPGLWTVGLSVPGKGEVSRDADAGAKGVDLTAPR